MATAAHAAQHTQEQSALTRAGASSDTESSQSVAPAECADREQDRLVLAGCSSLLSARGGELDPRREVELSRSLLEVTAACASLPDGPAPPELRLELALLAKDLTAALATGSDA